LVVTVKRNHVAIGRCYSHFWRSEVLSSSES
jgi:hypothetical protein